MTEGRRYTVRFASEVGQAIRELPAGDREELRVAFERAERDPWSWPQADRYDLDDTVRVVTVARAIVHFAILPEPQRLWAFAISVL